MEVATAGLAQLCPGVGLGTGTSWFSLSLAQGLACQEVPLYHHKTTQETMFLVLIMCTLNPSPLLGKKDKIRVLHKTLDTIDLNNFSVDLSLYLGWVQ